MSNHNTQSNYDEQDFAAANKFIGERQTYQSRPKRVADVIAKLMARRGYGQQQSATQLQVTWDDLMPGQHKKQTQAGMVRRGVLDVVVTNSMLRQHIEFDKQRLINELNLRLPNSKIKDIRFRIGTLENNG